MKYKKIIFFSIASSHGVTSAQMKLCLDNKVIYRHHLLSFGFKAKLQNSGGLLQTNGPQWAQNRCVLTIKS